MKKRIILIVFSLLFLLSGSCILLYKIEPFQYFFYLISWWSYIIFVDTALSFKEKRFLILNKGLPLLIVISSGFWCIFEIINIRIQNWFYINLPIEIYQRYMGYLFSYGTVIPAIYVTKECIYRLIGEIRTKPFYLKNYPAYSMLIGIATIVLTYLFPSHLFPFTWIFLAFLLDGYNYSKGYASFMKDLEKGLIGNFTATLLSGLICGILWESWNFWSVAKWVYTVPFFEDMKIFEMPIPGYIGFLVFSLEAVTYVNFLKGIEAQRRYIYLIALASLVFSVFSFTMIDRYTVFSYAPKIDEASFIDKNRLDYFISKGVRTSYGIDTSLLNENEKDSIKLLHLKGLGTANFLKLQHQGIRNINDLSRLDERTLSRILNEDNLRRVRVYIKAAKKVVKSE